MTEIEMIPHPNGGGLVASTAHVDPTAYIDGDARVYGYARVYGDAQVYGDARVSGGEWSTSPLQVVLGQFYLTHCAPGHVQIGCQRHSIEHWIEHGLEIAAAEDFPEALIPITRAIIENLEKTP